MADNSRNKDDSNSKYLFIYFDTINLRKIDA